MLGIIEITCQMGVMLWDVDHGADCANFLGFWFDSWSSATDHGEHWTEKRSFWNDFNV